MTTHWHFDHNNGAIAYRDAFPGVTLIAERNTARWIELEPELLEGVLERARLRAARGAREARGRSSRAAPARTASPSSPAERASSAQA